ncbi:hypothetical protein [Candidatus Halocynthiibacter alkanivorans]|uniref:hypothetical protein n=1 Tax=Candidatus Halocynthiibacter alkanivorans TaxID=2267619 RepID=UPI00109D4520|nr:hypothetical protein [Candidatus Halocynthiibacter alkanivorans]
MSDNLVGTKVAIRWNDFTEQEQRAIIVVDESSAYKLLLKLDAPFERAGVTYGHVVALPRLSCDDIANLEIDSVFGCALTWVPDSIFNSLAPTDLTWWRGGAAAIADLYIREK